MADGSTLLPQTGKFKKTGQGQWLHATRSWFSLVLLAPPAIGTLFSSPHFVSGTWQDFGCHAAGWLLFCAGAAMRWWGTLYVGGRKTAQLVTSGPYSISRNPIYIGTFLLTLSVGVLSQSAVLLLVALVASLFFLAVTVPDEERALRELHGAKFEAYCERVPRFFPKVQRFHSPDSIEVHLSALRTELIRMSRWVWIPVLCDVVAHLRAESWWPIWFWLP